VAARAAPVARPAPAPHNIRLAGAAVAGAVSLAGCSSVRIARAARFRKTGDKLNMAFIGSGGRGGSNLKEFYDLGEHVVALCDVDRGVPEVWGSVYDVRNLLNATVMLRDGKPITDMKLNPIERGVLKQIVKKLDSTDIPTLLKEYGVI
jgi:hypothetical protein